MVVILLILMVWKHCPFCLLAVSLVFVDKTLGKHVIEVYIFQVGKSCFWFLYSGIKNFNSLSLINIIKGAFHYAKDFRNFVQSNWNYCTNFWFPLVSIARSSTLMLQKRGTYVGEFLLSAWYHTREHLHQPITQRDLACIVGEGEAKYRWMEGGWEKQRTCSFLFFLLFFVSLQFPQNTLNV